MQKILQTGLKMEITLSHRKKINLGSFLVYTKKQIYTHRQGANWLLLTKKQRNKENIFKKLDIQKICENKTCWQWTIPWKNLNDHLNFSSLVQLLIWKYFVWAHRLFSPKIWDFSFFSEGRKVNQCIQAFPCK